MASIELPLWIALPLTLMNFILLLWLSLVLPLKALQFDFQFSNFAWILNSEKAASGILKSFLKSGDYQNVLRFLDNPVISMKLPYTNACSTMTLDNIKAIMACPTLRPNDLINLLSPECLHAAGGALKNDPGLIHFLPSNPLESDRSFRSQALSPVFHNSLQLAITNETPKINWRALLSSSVDSISFLSLQQLIPVESIIEWQRHSFMSHLTPEIIHMAADEDLQWFAQICKPEMPLSFSNNTDQSFKLLEVQLFRFITTFLIRKRVNSRLARFRSDTKKALSRRQTRRMVRYEAFLFSVNETLTNFRAAYRTPLLLNEKIKKLDKSFQKAFEAIQPFAKPDYSFMSSIVNRCNFFLHLSDWMINLIDWFPLSFFKKKRNLKHFLRLFLSKKPSNSAISELFTTLYLYKMDTNDLFYLLAEPQKHSLVLTASFCLSKQQKFEFSFKERKRVYLRQLRAVHFSHFPSENNRSIIRTVEQFKNEQDRVQRLDYLKEILRAVIKDGIIIDPFAVNFFKHNSSPKLSLPGTCYLRSFFHLFLSFKETFYIKLGIEPSSQKRPIIAISPLMPPLIVFALGKCLYASLLYCYRIPFVLDWSQFESVLSGIPADNSFLQNFSWLSRDLRLAADLKDAYLKKDANEIVKTMIPALKGFVEPHASQLPAPSDLVNFCLLRLSEGFINSVNLSLSFTAQEIYSILFYQ